jgi:hypothetical protein
VIAAAARAKSRAAVRTFWAACAGSAGAVLTIARVVTPDPSGFGTHRQLGLPGCAFLALTSLPCPACGLTTSFAHMARLQITSALHANAIGVPLFALVLVSLPCSLIACACALPIAPTIQWLRVSPLLAIICVSALLSWIARVAAIVLAS